MVNLHPYIIFEQSYIMKTNYKFLKILFVTLILSFSFSGIFSGFKVALADIVIATVDVGDYPQSLEFNPSNKNIYVGNSNSDDVSVIDSSTNAVVATVDVGDLPADIEFNPSNKNIYVGNYRSHDVSVIDSSTNAVVATVDVGSQPRYNEFNPSNNNVYVGNIGSNDVSVISSTTVPVQPPTATTITSSIDSNGNLVQNESSTVSTSIAFEVIATEGTNPIAGYECSIDGNLFSNWSTSDPATISYDNLGSEEEHIFKVRAIDAQGNTDANPATFIWTVLTPEQAMQKLIDTIDEMGISKGTKNSLQAPLNAASNHLGNNNEGAACGSLGAFLNQVDAKEGNGQLTTQQSSGLRQQATAIQQEIGCSSSFSSSNSSIDSIIDSTPSNMDSTQSKQTNKALDIIKKSIDPMR